VLEREVGRVLERFDRRLDPAAVIDDDLDPLPLDQALDPLGVPERGDARVGDEHRAGHAESLQLPAGVGRSAGTVLHRRSLHREDGLKVGRHGSLLLFPTNWVG
jgi:hypothetical protein